MVAEDVGKRMVVSESEVPECFSDLMARVAEGETVAITRNGNVVAELSPGPEPEPEFDQERAEAAVARFLEDRAKWTLTNVTLEEILAWRHEGHRW